MNAEDLIETIQASGVPSADEMKSILEDGYILSLIFELPDFDPDDEASVMAHAEAQAIAEKAYSLLYGLSGGLPPFKEIRKNEASRISGRSKS